MTIYRVGNSSLNLRNPVTVIRHRCAKEGQWTRNAGRTRTPVVDDARGCWTGIGVSDKMTREKNEIRVINQGYGIPKIAHAIPKSHYDGKVIPN